GRCPAPRPGCPRTDPRRQRRPHGRLGVRRRQRGSRAVVISERLPTSASTAAQGWRNRLADGPPGRDSFSAPLYLLQGLLDGARQGGPEQRPLFSERALVGGDCVQVQVLLDGLTAQLPAGIRPDDQGVGLDLPLAVLLDVVLHEV